MRNKPHLHLEEIPDSVPYSYAGGVPVNALPFQLPPRDRVPHGRARADEVRNAVAESERLRQEQADLHVQDDGQIKYITFTLRSDPGFQLRLERLDRVRQKIRLLSSRVENGIYVATISMPINKVVGFLKLIENYARRDNSHGNADNRELIESISSISLTVVQDLWSDSIPIPSLDATLWLEVWLHQFNEQPEQNYQRFAQLAQMLGFQVTSRYVKFPERLVTLAFGSLAQLSKSLDLLTLVAEVRKAKELASHYTQLSGREQADFVQHAAQRIIPPARTAPAVCLLDTGVNRGHLLLAPALEPSDLHAVDIQWGNSDHDPHQHGTTMAGIALYGCLTTILDSVDPIRLKHRLESVKLIPPPPGENSPDVYGAVTKEATARVESVAPERNRAYCLTITTDDLDNGLPSQWSAALDDCCHGGLEAIPKLVFVSAGNIGTEFFASTYSYHDWNCQKAGIEEPAQAWNAVTVGAYTEKVIERETLQDGWQVIAEPGDLTPTSRTSLPWPPDNQKEWPIKPDIVMEGGNYIEKNGERDNLDDLSLLTTCLKPTGQLLTTTRDTSPAAASAARMAAVIWSYYPQFWPETVRALMIHSAQWTPAMIRRFPGNNKSVIQKRLRCYGYGVPDLEKALFSAQNAATLIYQGELQPYHRKVSVNADGDTTENPPSTNEMHLHALPWPIEVLQQLGELNIKMHVTLSYYIESSPGRVVWGRKYRYQSHGLRFDLKRPTESLQAFRRRLTKHEWENGNRPSIVPDTRSWLIGEARNHGSIHSDWWHGNAATLAASSHIAIYPVTGWWKERPHLNKYNSKARYSLVITIETPNAEIDLYGAITAQPEVMTEIEVTS
ncbi:MAG: S8 family peptidase [Planctomycetia bacterium]|nr:S8 family peptidase [Planctomycetia bacterium]